MSQASIARKHQVRKVNSHLARVKRLASVMSEMDPDGRTWASGEIRQEMRKIGGAR
jgi:hypothetical protein